MADDQFGLGAGHAGVVGLGAIGPVLLGELGHAGQLRQRGRLFVGRGVYVEIQRRRDRQRRRLGCRAAVRANRLLLRVREDDRADRVDALAQLSFSEQIAGEIVTGAGKGLLHGLYALRIVAFLLPGNFQGFEAGIAGAVPLRGGRRRVGQRHRLLERVYVGVRSARRFQCVEPQKNRIALILAVDFRHLDENLQRLGGAFRLLRAGGLLGRRQLGLGKLQGYALVAVGLPQTAVLLQPDLRLREKLLGILLGDDQQAEVLCLRKDRVQPR